MKESKEACGSSRPPKPNLKNKNFEKWTKAESCKQEDNIVSTDWHVKLKNVPPFLPVYDNKPVNMIYLMSGEYGRLWKKERDDWFGKVFILKPKEKDMMQRKKKIRQQIKESKKAAEANIKERKERRAKELEAKAKAEAEKAEKLRARIQKLQAPKLPPRTPKKSKEAKPKPNPELSEQKQEICPKGWQPVELTIQCECSNHNKNHNEGDLETEKLKEKSSAEEKKEIVPEIQSSDEGCTMCEGYIKQLQEVQEAKSNVKASNEVLNTETEKEVKAE